MKRFLIAKKQGDQTVYVSSIAKNKIGETLNCWEALDFKDKDVAIYVTIYLNDFDLKTDKSNKYQCLVLEYTVNYTVSDDLGK